MKKLVVAFSVFLCVLFVFSAFSAGIFAEEKTKEPSVARSDEVIATIDGIDFYDYDRFYNYLLDHYTENRKALPTTLVGTWWLFHSHPIFDINSYSSNSFSNNSNNGFFGFSTNGAFGTRLTLNSSSDSLVAIYNLSDYTVYSNNTWSSPFYRLIYFTQNPVTFDHNNNLTTFITWLSNNATQVNVNSVSVTNSSSSDFVYSCSFDPLSRLSTVSHNSSRNIFFPSSYSLNFNCANAYYGVVDSISSATYSYISPLQINGGTSSLNTILFTSSSVSSTLSISSSSENPSNYHLTASISNGTASFNPSTVSPGDSSTVTITPSSGYTYPATISVSGSYGSISSLGNGSWSISNITSDLIVTVTCVYVQPSLTASLSVGYGTGSVTSPSGTGSSSVSFYSGDSVSVTVVPSSGYTLPSSITVTGTYDSVTSSQSGVWIISNPTSNLSITAVCVAVAPSYVSVELNFANCTLSYSQTVVGNTFTGTVVPNTGYTYPVSVTGQSAGIPLTISYNSSNGMLTITNCPSEIVLYAQAVAVSADCDITYDLDHCSCSISYTSVSSGTVLSFTLTPDSGYLLSDQDTVVSLGGAAEAKTDVLNSYSFSYNFTVTGDVDIVGVAVPYRQALSAAYQSGYDTGSINGGGSYSGSYRDGYNQGFIDGVDAVNPSSLDQTAYQRYVAIFNSGVDFGLASVSSSGSGEGLSLYNSIYNSGFDSGVNSVNALALDGSVSFSVYNSAFNAGVESVSSQAPSGSYSNERYLDIYNVAYANGLAFGESEGVSEALTTFIPSTIAAIGGGLLYTGEHISIFGVTLLSLVGVVLLVAIALWVFKIFKGSL